MAAQTTRAGLPDARATLDVPTLLRLQLLVRDIEIGEHLLRYATRLVRATRPDTSPIAGVTRNVAWGAGPRAVQALVLTSKARALMQGRLAVTRDDVAAMLQPVLAHRVLRTFEAQANGVQVADILDELLDALAPD